MARIDITETGIIAFTGVVCAFLIKCCLVISQSRCKVIKCCGIHCERELMNDVEMRAAQRIARDSHTDGEGTGPTRV